MFYILEFIGWAIVVFGVVLVVILLNLALDRKIFEAMTLSLPSIIVFRGGLGLVRFAVAGRIAGKLNRMESRETS